MVSPRPLNKLQPKNSEAVSIVPFPSTSIVGKFAILHVELLGGRQSLATYGSSVPTMTLMGYVRLQSFQSVSIKQNPPKKVSPLHRILGRVRYVTIRAIRRSSVAGRESPVRCTTSGW
jgi:hypothetical protein